MADYANAQIRFSQLSKRDRGTARTILKAYEFTVEGKIELGEAYECEDMNTAGPEDMAAELSERCPSAAFEINQSGVFEILGSSVYWHPDHGQATTENNGSDDVFERHAIREALDTGGVDAVRALIDPPAFLAVESVLKQFDDEERARREAARL
jgi:hypothetical protein